MTIEKYIQRGQEVAAQENAQRQIMRAKKFDTIAVHGLYDMQAALDNQGSVIEPLYLSTSQHFEDSDHLEAAMTYQTPSWIYSRFANPTLYYLEQTLALLEGYGGDIETSAFVTASGGAATFMATNSWLMNAQSGKTNIVVQAHCYGGTFQLFNERYHKEQGIEIRWVTQPYNADDWASKIDSHTRFVFGEMPSNPTMQVLPIAEVAEAAHQHGIPLIIDSTVATPALMRPLCFGADIVTHSLTKSMTSSGVALAGAVISRKHIGGSIGPDTMREDFATYAKWVPFRDFGPGLSPFNAMMVLNDLRTLRTRMDQVSKNAEKVAQFLNDHPNVDRVYYPSLEHTPEHDLAAKYMWLADSADDYGAPVNRYGHLMSFEVKGGVQATRRFFDKLQLIFRATDLGRIKSIATIPAISTHQQQGEAGRSLAAIPPNLIRLNVGGEHPADVIADLAQGLDGIR